jgi:hypothetical protein
MKLITNLSEFALPMPDGRMLPAKGKLRVPDHIAGNERVRSWGLNVLVEDYEVPTFEEPAAEAPKGKGKATDKAPDVEKA